MTDESKNTTDSLPDGEQELTDNSIPIVYMTSDISSGGLMAVCEALGAVPEGKIAIKISTGEPGSNYLRTDLIGELVQSLDGTIVECNTAYGGQRANTTMHYQVAKDHGYTEIADVDIMDEEGSMILAVEDGSNLTEFVSIQGHYNLIAREEEREMAPFCRDQNIAMTPYSALAGGRLSKHPGETSKRLVEDSYAKFKYDSTAEVDGKIIARVAEIADKRDVSMTEVALAWLLTKVAAPVVGATKISHVEGAAKSVELELNDNEINYLEELYVPHALVGVMAQNGKQAAGNVV